MCTEEGDASGSGVRCYFLGVGTVLIASCFIASCSGKEGILLKREQSLHAIPGNQIYESVSLEDLHKQGIALVKDAKGTVYLLSGCTIATQEDLDAKELQVIANEDGTHFVVQYPIKLEGKCMIQVPLSAEGNEEITIYPIPEPPIRMKTEQTPE